VGPLLYMVLGQHEEIDMKTDGIGATRVKWAMLARLGYQAMPPTLFRPSG
jgi:hypothetical protein